MLRLGPSLHYAKGWNFQSFLVQLTVLGPIEGWVLGTSVFLDKSFPAPQVDRRALGSSRTILVVLRPLLSIEVTK